MKIITRILLSQIFLAGVVFSFSNSSFAADAKKNSADAATLSPELKHDMADMYSKMADCMNTDKSMVQCQKDIMKDCPVMKKTGHCPIMDGMKPMMRKGAMGGGKMKEMGPGMSQGMAPGMGQEMKQEHSGQ
jgi:hypothetical protein